MAEIIDFDVWRQRQANSRAMRRSGATPHSALPDHVDVYYGFWDPFDDDLTPCDIENDASSEQP